MGNDILMLTNPYNYSSFENIGGIIKGRITMANGSGISQAVVYLSGVDFTTTDTNGSYNISVPFNGNATVALYSNISGQWWNVINGQYGTQSVTAVIPIQTNATINLDFTLVPPLLPACGIVPTSGCAVYD